jgi:hypothetical protein
VIEAVGKEIALAGRRRHPPAYSPNPPPALIYGVVAVDHGVFLSDPWQTRVNVRCFLGFSTLVAVRNGPWYQARGFGEGLLRLREPAGFLRRVQIFMLDLDACPRPARQRHPGGFIWLTIPERAMLAPVTRGRCSISL